MILVPRSWLEWCWILSWDWLETNPPEAVPNNQCSSICCWNFISNSIITISRFREPKQLLLVFFAWRSNWIALIFFSTGARSPNPFGHVWKIVFVFHCKGFQTNSFGKKYNKEDHHGRETWKTTLEDIEDPHEPQLMVAPASRATTLPWMSLEELKNRCRIYWWTLGRH